MYAEVKRKCQQKKKEIKCYGQSCRCFIMMVLFPFTCEILGNASSINFDKWRKNKLQRLKEIEAKLTVNRQLWLEHVRHTWNDFASYEEKKFSKPFQRKKYTIQSSGWISFKNDKTKNIFFLLVVMSLENYIL